MMHKSATTLSAAQRIQTTPRNVVWLVGIASAPGAGALKGED